MLKFKKKNLSYLYIFFLILVLFFSKFSTNIASSNNYNISKVKVEEIYDLKFEKNKIIDRAFKKAFKILIYKITENKDKSIAKNISLNEIKSLIENFSIIDERFTNNKYISEFNVQFNKKKILRYLNNKGAIPSSPKKIKVFLLPVLIDENSNELYDLNNNIFYKNWDFNSKKYHLIEYVLPNEDIEDYSIIRKNIKNIENYNFKEIIDKYNLQNEIILIILKSNSQIQVFSKIKFDKNIMLVNNIYDVSSFNDNSVIDNIILDIKEVYEDKWKSINKINTSIMLPIRLSIDSKNIELSKKFENKIYSTDLISNYKIERFNNQKVIYKIIFNSTQDRFLDIMSSYNFKIDTSQEIWTLQ